MILISAIIAVGVISFIADSAEGLDSAARRSRLAAAGQVAIQRISFELHNALPNSIRTTSVTASGDQCIEFIPVRAATTYIDPGFTGAGASSFEVVEFFPSQDGETGGFAVIYPAEIDRLYAGDNSMDYADWPDHPNIGPIKEIDNIADSATANQSTVTLTGSHRFRRRSPTERIFVVDQPVSYCVKGSNLYRYTDYGFFASQVSEEESGSCIVTTPARCLPNYDAVPTRQKVLINNSIDNNNGGDTVTAFSVATQTLSRNALVNLSFNLTSGEESFRLNHEVLTRSVP